MDKRLSEVLGFFFMVYQKDPRKTYVTCWLDGDDEPEYYTEKDIIGFATKLENDYKTVSRLKDTFTETSFFMWDVDNKKIKRLSAGYEPREISPIIFEQMKDKKPLSNNYQIGWRGVLNEQGLRLN